MAYFNSNDLPPKILGFGHDIHYNRTFHCNCFFAWLVAGKERKTFGKIAASVWAWLRGIAVTFLTFVLPSVDPVGKTLTLVRRK